MTGAGGGVASAAGIWRRCNRAAGYRGSWLDTIPPSAVAAVLALHEHGPMTGSALAERTTGQQANMTRRTLPRLAACGFVLDSPGDGVRGRTGRPTEWKLTDLGRILARRMIENGERP